MWHHIKRVLQVIRIATSLLVSSPHRTVLGKTTKCSSTFYLVHTTLPNYNRVTRVSAHRLHWNFISFLWNRKLKRFFPSLSTALYKNCARGGAYCDVQTLVWSMIRHRYMYIPLIISDLNSYFPGCCINIYIIWSNDAKWVQSWAVNIFSFFFTFLQS